MDKVKECEYCGSKNLAYQVQGNPLKVGNKIYKGKVSCMSCKWDRFIEQEMKIKCKGHKPSYANEFAAGLDLKSNTEILLHPGQIADIESRLAVEIPPGHFGMIVARSGLSYKRQIKLINDVGIIDEDYRGNIGIRLINEGSEYYQIKEGDRIAQMIIIPYVQPKLVYVDELSETGRNKSGLGSTGR